MSMMIRDSWMITMVRAGVRYAPHPAIRSGLWHRLVEPEFAWRDHAFVSHTAAGRLAGNTRDILQQYLYYFGVWEPEVTAFLQRRLMPGDGFVDIGANIGYFSLLAAKRVGPTGRVIAIEASPSVYEHLVGNVHRNSAHQVTTLNIAAASEAGRVKLYCGQDCNCGATSIVPEGNETAIAEVETAPLAAIIDERDWNKTRLVKIDVEGAEAGVVRGFNGLIEKGRTDREFLIEVHPLQLQQLGNTVEEVLAPFRAAGYHAYTIGNDYDPESYLSRAQPARPQRMVATIDCDTNVILSRVDRSEL